jgi:hypothetical protein
MVNLNPGIGSEECDHHTHYLRFRDEYKYIESFWDGNPSADRCWVPWSWCETKKMQRENNSIVIFSPSNRTVHGVKANYDHLAGQRTQLYGNLWYHEVPVKSAPQWEDYTIYNASLKRAAKPANPIRAALPEPVVGLLKNVKGMVQFGDKKDVGKRNRHLRQ